MRFGWGVRGVSMLLGSETVTISGWEWILGVGSDR
jgi:hypothetical protein